MPRPKAIGWLMKSDPEEARREIIDAIEIAGGNVRRAAFILAIGQPWLCRLVVRHNLRGVVARARARSRRPDWLVNARRALGMDEQLQAVVEACKGKSAEEIQALIESSANAGAFEDPGLVAAYIATLAAA
jgi:transposase